MNSLQNIGGLFCDSGMLFVFPIAVLILGLLLKVKLFQTIKSGILMVTAFVGIKMMVLFLCNSMAPVIAYFSEKDGYQAVDVGWQAFALSSWMMPFALISVVLGFLLNVLLVKKNRVRTLNTDIWDYCHILFCGAIAYVIFHSFLLSAGICIAALLITIKSGDWISSLWQDHTESPGTTGSVLYHLTTMYPIYWLCDRVIDKIPVIRKIDISADKFSLRMRPFGDSVIAGLLMGGGLGLCDE